MTRLTGAAARSQARRVLLDEARHAITRRDPDAIADTVALLRAVNAKTPCKAPDELASVYYSGHGINHGTYPADIPFGGVL